jgi:hypothetical protein
MECSTRVTYPHVVRRAVLGWVFGLIVAAVVAGCGGGGGGATTHGSNSWSVTVANNLGAQTGPSQVTALQAAALGYRHANPKDRANMHAGPCNPDSGGLVWTCAVHGSQCTATVTVSFTGLHDTAGLAREIKTECPGMSSDAVAGEPANSP